MKTIPNPQISQTMKRRIRRLSALALHFGLSLPVQNEALPLAVREARGPHTKPFYDCASPLSLTHRLLSSQSASFRSSDQFR